METTKEEAYFHVWLSGESQEYVEAFVQKIVEMAEKENITMWKPKYVELLGMIADHKI